ncbi:hypothetical protein C0Q70_14053 [Pomacea canaliculata]|uniref:GH10 domain-containing protein n=1 Tax=Pomacea canaliculata TaxID=400727 RepID=A0A2T7NYY4_POMCA|nr:hypothetical protein C0Q70_14053 [Pomacea canaliculata]
MQTLIAWVVCALVASVVSQEVLQNGGFESLDHWDCWSPIQCKIVTDSHSGAGAMEIQNRKKYWQGPSQYINVTRGTGYEVSAHIKLQNDRGIGHRVELQVEFEMTDGTHEYKRAASQEETRVDDGWVHLIGLFYVPNKDVRLTRIHFQGPEEGISFVVDDASVKRMPSGAAAADVSSEIDRLRRSNIVVHVTAGANINHGQVNIRVVQKKKSFPFGTAVDTPPTTMLPRQNTGISSTSTTTGQCQKTHSSGAASNKLGYRITKQMTGRVGGYELMGTCELSAWPEHGSRTEKSRVRGHCLVWSVDSMVQNWVKALHGDELRKVVHGPHWWKPSTHLRALEHWDVNNENLHGKWYQNQLNEPNYNLELFRIAHAADPNVKLFLNDYGVVAWSTDVNHRLDTLAQVGVPIWATELDVRSTDENKRADFYEHALTALYSHHAVEGILMWGFWDKTHWLGVNASLVVGDNLQLTAAGRRVLELFEHRWI